MAINIRDPRNLVSEEAARPWTTSIPVKPELADCACLKNFQQEPLALQGFEDPRLLEGLAPAKHLFRYGNRDASLVHEAKAICMAIDNQP